MFHRNGENNSWKGGNKICGKLIERKGGYVKLNLNNRTKNTDLITMLTFTKSR